MTIRRRSRRQALTLSGRARRPGPSTAPCCRRRRRACRPSCRRHGAAAPCPLAVRHRAPAVAPDLPGPAAAGQRCARYASASQARPRRPTQHRPPAARAASAAVVPSVERRASRQRTSVAGARSAGRRRPRRARRRRRPHRRRRAPRRRGRPDPPGEPRAAATPTCGRGSRDRGRHACPGPRTTDSTAAAAPRPASSSSGRQVPSEPAAHQQRDRARRLPRGRAPARREQRCHRTPTPAARRHVGEDPGDPRPARHRDQQAGAEQPAEAQATRLRDDRPRRARRPSEVTVSSRRPQRRGGGDRPEHGGAPCSGTPRPPVPGRSRPRCRRRPARRPRRRAAGRCGSRSPCRGRRRSRGSRRRRRTAPRRVGSSSSMISIARGFGRAGQRAGREGGGEHVVGGRGPGASSPDDGGDQVHDVAVPLDAHEVDDLDGARHADPAEVVAGQVDEHHVLGALLRVGEQLLGERGVLLRRGAARPGAGDRVQRWPGRRSTLTSASGLEPTTSNGGRRGVAAAAGTCTGWGWSPAAPGRRPARRPRQSSSNRWKSTTWNTSPARICLLARSTAAR